MYICTFPELSHTVLSTMLVGCASIGTCAVSLTSEGPVVWLQYELAISLDDVKGKLLRLLLTPEHCHWVLWQQQGQEGQEGQDGAG
jgi:hypothetical protein